MRGLDLHEDCPTVTEKTYLSLWPNRYTNLPDGPLSQGEKANLIQKLRNKIIQARK